jgi:hypothetical protein
VLSAIGLVVMLAWQVSSVPSAGIVESLTGNASIRSPQEKQSKPVRPYAWLATGSELSVGPNSTVVVLFADGSRWQFGENSTADLAMDGPSRRRGNVQFLGSVPPLPRILPIAGGGPSRAGAVRIRTGERIRGLYPFPGVSTMAGRTVLRFSALQNVSTYRIEIQDNDGKTILSRETNATEISIPSAVLVHGARYHWQVRGIVAAGPEPRGEATFETLSAENDDRRAALHQVIRNPQDSSSLALLAQIDSALGLFDEALAGLRASVALVPKNQTVNAELQRLQQVLTDDH